MKVLIVDDNDTIRAVIRICLERSKHEVLGEAGDVGAAVKAFAELRPEVVLLDLIMPGGTGLEVLEKIKAIDPSVKVIVITAVEQDALDKKISERGAGIILRKPFSNEELESAMKSIAGQP